MFYHHKAIELIHLVYTDLILFQTKQLIGNFIDIWHLALALALALAFGYWKIILVVFANN